MREYVGEVLSDAGYECISVESGMRALSCLADTEKLSRTQLGDKGAAVLKLGSLGESSKSLTTKENRREETVSHS